MKKTFFIFLILLLLSSKGYGQITRDSIQHILNNESVEAEQRVLAVFTAMKTPIEDNERKYILEKVLKPFVDKSVKSQLHNQTYNIAIQMALLNVSFKLRDMDGRMEAMTRAFELAETPMKDTATASAEVLALYNGERANVYRVYGQMQTQVGDMALGHKYLYKAIRLYESLEQYERASTSLYIIASNFHEIKDVKRLSEIVKQMEQLLQKNASQSERYNLYSTKVGYYSLLLESDTTHIDYASVDSLLANSYRCIFIIENHPNALSRTVNPAITYYNVATTLYKYYPKKIDTVYIYLDKALKAKLAWDPVSSKEIDLRVNLMYARLYFKDKQYGAAEKKLQQVLLLLNDVKDRNTVIPDYAETYQLLAEVSEKTGRLQDAVNYQKKFLENKEKLYNHEKIKAINDMATKYEVEKKEAQITWLEEKNRTAQKILMLTIGLLSVLLIATILLVYFFRLRKKNLEQKVYESALLAEMQQTELEYNAEEKKLLQQKYKDLEAQANQSVQQAGVLHSELQHIKKQMEQKPTQSLIEKTIQAISKSLIEKDSKIQYVERLNTLDTDMLEQGYLAANEKITNMDMKYIICFAVDMEVKDISLIYNVEPASVRTVRYRIKKKFNEKNTFKFLL